MPSPFPGMDPYLEGHFWTTLHHALAAEIVRQLSPRLRPRYMALAEERFVTEEGDDARNLYPDVAVVPSDFIAEATVAYKAHLRMTTIVEPRVPHSAVEIRAAASGELVTAIEILSPTNKRPRGHVQYLARRQRILHSEAHLLEIDLLRRGTRLPVRERLPESPYFVFLSRAEERPAIEVWPIVLAETLPVVPVPLLPGDPDVELDLQAAFAEVYEVASYDRRIDYSRPPEVAFTEGEAKIAGGVLAAHPAG